LSAHGPILPLGSGLLAVPGQSLPATSVARPAPASATIVLANLDPDKRPVRPADFGSWSTSVRVDPAGLSSAFNYSSIPTSSRSGSSRSSSSPDHATLDG
jgi:hypothetical protein